MSQLIRTNEHAPANLRAYVPASNHPAFYRAFGLPVPDNLPRIW
jgi:predicted metalloendopeptidase